MALAELDDVLAAVVLELAAVVDVVPSADEPSLLLNTDLPVVDAGTGLEAKNVDTAFPEATLL